MGQIADNIIYDIAQQWLPITFDAIRSALRKHLEPQKKVWCNTIPDTIKMLSEPQKKAECEHNFVSTFGNAWTICSKCWKKIWLSDVLPQQEDKNIEKINRIMSNFNINWINYWIEWYKELTEKINEIISYLNNR